MYFQPPPTFQNVPPECEWHIGPPLIPGTYEFSCGEGDFQPESAEIVDRDGELWATIGGEFRPLQMWQDGLTEPAWRLPL